MNSGPSTDAVPPLLLQLVTGLYLFALPYFSNRPEK